MNQPTTAPEELPKTREKTIFRAPDAVVSTHTARFDGLSIPISDVIAAHTETDDRSGFGGLMIAANVFVAAGVLFWLPVIAGEWRLKFLIAVVLLGGVGLSLIQDALSVPDRRVTKLVLTTAKGARVVYVSKNEALVMRIADAILSAKTLAHVAPPEPLQTGPTFRTVARELAKRNHTLASGDKECEAEANPAWTARTAA